jgi:hypothetical protein
MRLPTNDDPTVTARALAVRLPLTQSRCFIVDVFRTETAHAGGIELRHLGAPRLGGPLAFDQAARAKISKTSSP